VAPETPADPANRPHALVAKPYSYREARAIAEALDLSEPVAVALVRRGHRSPGAAREFLDAAEAHDPLEFDSMEEIAGRLAAAARDGRRITVHGDYDVDGVSSTSILVRALRELGATCDWLIPDRAGDGYGLTLGSVAELARRGTELLVTVDCGISCAAEVQAAREAGIEAIVTDHHQPPELLPDCPILHPAVSGYPFAELCATAVAAKLAQALRRSTGAGGAEDPRDLQLVALATVADMVPLVGENRRLVRDGLAEMRRGASPGLRALMAVSRTDPAAVGASDLGFRLAPRINAAGRLYRADAGVELMLSEDPERAAEIAAELDRANSERRATERELVSAAERAYAELDEAQREAAAIVLAGEGWHGGVVGIVASRLVERYARPVVLIATDGGTGRGSGRSVPGFDLVEALGACAGHLGRFGGHAMAAGLEIDAGEVEAFREAFLAHAAATAPPAAMARESVDAVVGVGREGIGIELAEQFDRLAPFGAANPEPRLLVPAARIGEVRPMGESGDHARFQLTSGAGRAQGIAFRMHSELARLDGRDADLLASLEVNRWNGSVEPRIQVRSATEIPAPFVREGPDVPRACATPAGAAEWWGRVEDELAAPLADWPGPRVAEALLASGAGADRALVDRRGGAAVAAITELASSGDAVLALCADAARRRHLVERAADPARFGADAAALACMRCADGAAADALEAAAAGRHNEAAAGGLALADWAVLARAPELARGFDHVVLIEPPPFDHLRRLAAAAAGPADAAVAPLHPGFLHLAWSGAEEALALRQLEHEWELRPHTAELFRLVAGPGELAGEDLRQALSGPGRYPRSPELAARTVRVLVELGLCEWQADPAGGLLGVVSSEGTDLERSEAYRAYRARYEEGQSSLKRQRQSERVPEAA
jgi:single-stranded-DNA-specific exonuclease